MTKKFNAGDKVRNLRVRNDHFGLKVGDVYTVRSLVEGGRFVRFTEKGGGWYVTDFELVEDTPTTLRYADVQPGDVIKVTRELTVTGRTYSGALKCDRSDGASVTLGVHTEPFLTLELVSRKAPPLTIGDTVRCILTDKVGTLTGTSEGKYAWVVFGGSTRPKTRMLTELVRHTAA